MYGDTPPVPNAPVRRVLVLEEGDKPYNHDRILEMADGIGATNRDGDGDKIYWIVFADKPGQIVDFTERTLRLIK